MFVGPNARGLQSMLLQSLQYLMQINESLYFEWFHFIVEDGFSVCVFKVA